MSRNWDDCDRAFVDWDDSECPFCARSRAARVYDEHVSTAVAEGDGTVNAVEATEDVPLTAEDRCDCCGAQALYRATVTSGDLLFCGHHYRENVYALYQAGARIYPGAE